jgi:hypothetical protein
MHTVVYLPKTEEVRYLEKNLTETEIEQRIADSYDFEFDSYGSISSSKVYGPMHRTSAGSANERTNNERFTTLKIRCLGDNCSNSTAVNWHHTSCGGSFQVFNYAHLKCDGCSLVGDLKDFSFNCANHRHSEYYRTAGRQMDVSSLKRALFVALSQGVMEENTTLELMS